MSRIRSLKPEFFVSEQVVECSTNARLLFIGLWCFCDDAGIHPASTKRLKMEVFPADAFTDDDVQQWMDELNRAGLVSTYRAENTDYWRVTGWSRHQKIDRPTYRYPQPEPSKIADASPNNRRGLAEHSPSPRDGVESNGVESNGSRPVPDGTGCRQPAADNANADIQKREFCPYQQIINAYHVHFPSGPQVSKLTDKRKRSIAARWNEVRKGEYRPAGQSPTPRDAEKALQFFQRYFAYCESQPWCTGREPMKDGKLFRATIDNLVGAEFMAKRSDAAHDAREGA
ncbi:MAG: hypothetical protein IPH39_18800 [Sulfuritalea sp.]|jgi:hypothetical protein|nr:hypothetical protein [Sulfuritalea sp.]MBK9352048.1 hypothetical protein [Sulfuritalea sp.]